MTDKEKLLMGIEFIIEELSAEVRYYTEQANRTQIALDKTIKLYEKHSQPKMAIMKPPTQTNKPDGKP